MRRMYGESRQGAVRRRLRLAPRATPPALFVVVLMLLSLPLGLALAARSGIARARPAATCAPPAECRYGPDQTAIANAAIAAGWPQQNSTWCGVATIAATAQYKQHAVSQADVAAYLKSQPSISEWGTAPKLPQNIGPAFAADIAGDVGTDPRSMAAALIQDAGGTYRQVVDFNGKVDATRHIVDDLIHFNEPINVIVDHGKHIVLVAGVFATGDPVANFGSVTALEVWDPGFDSGFGSNQNARAVKMLLSDWYTTLGYFGFPYNANPVTTKSGTQFLDPDPGIGAYFADPAKGQNARLWIGSFVYLQPLAAGAIDPTIARDWAFDQDGALILGIDGKPAPGWTGATVPMPVPPPPPPTPTPAPTATPAPPPPPTATAAPRRAAVATATAIPTVTPEPTVAATPIVIPTFAPPRIATPVASSAASNAPGAIPFPVIVAGGAVTLLALLGVPIFLLIKRRRWPPWTPGAGGASPGDEGVLIGARQTRWPPAPPGSGEH